MRPDELRETWRALWRRVRAVGDPDPPFEDLTARYAEPGRAYHNLTHIAECLRELAAVRDRLGWPATGWDAIEFAIWFHDAVYDAKAKDNEERSADLAREVAHRAGLPAAFGDGVARLILATRHSMPPATVDERILVDIDLAILGQPRERFEEYERQIREEYAWAPGELYRKGRAAVLSAFLARPAIYATPEFAEKYESKARENLASSLRRLA